MKDFGVVLTKDGKVIGSKEFDTYVQAFEYQQRMAWAPDEGAEITYSDAHKARVLDHMMANCHLLRFKIY